VLIMLAALVKAPALLALVFIVPLWAADLSGAPAGCGPDWRRRRRHRHRRRDHHRRRHGYGWLGTLDTPTLAHTWTSLTTDVGYSVRPA
jgi:alpha-1,6-mannosyltransferase